LFSLRTRYPTAKVEAERSLKPGKHVKGGAFLSTPVQQLFEGLLRLPSAPFCRFDDGTFGAIAGQLTLTLVEPMSYVPLKPLQSFILGAGPIPFKASIPKLLSLLDFGKNF
jgi:hypothetical protein